MSIVSEVLIYILCLTHLQQYDALFYETSAKTGSYVLETMLGMAR